MTRRTRIWLVVASVFTAINVGGGVYAAVMREGPHAGIHIVLTAVGVYWMWRLMARSRQQALPDAQADLRLQDLQQSVDAIAVEVERIGEAQRFTARKMAEQVQSPPPKPKL